MKDCLASKEICCTLLTNIDNLCSSWVPSYLTPDTLHPTVFGKQHYLTYWQGYLTLPDQIIYQIIYQTFLKTQYNIPFQFSTLTDYYEVGTGTFLSFCQEIYFLGQY